MHVILFRSGGWPSWDVEFEPLVREGMPVLVDDDLLFEECARSPEAGGGGQPVAAGAADVGCAVAEHLAGLRAGLAGLVGVPW